MLNQEFKLNLINKDGTEVTYDVIFTLEDSESNKKYIVFTDNTLDIKGRTKLFASFYTIIKGKISLIPIQTDEDYQFIESYINQIQNNSNEKEIVEIKTELKEESSKFENQFNSVNNNFISDYEFISIITKLKYKMESCDKDIRVQREVLIEVKEILDREKDVHRINLLYGMFRNWLYL